MEVMWQPTLGGSGPARPDPGFSSCRRLELAPDGGAWVDVAPGWLAGADAVFADLAATLAWRGQVVPMYERLVEQPRLHAALPSGDRPELVDEMADLLSGRYGVELRSAAANLYRDGQDSVAWHGDRVARDLPHAIVAIVSLRGRRRFRLRPKGGGRSHRFDLHSGDLVVMGGSCQRTWEHCVPKLAYAEPRISVTFRSAA